MESNVQRKTIFAKRRDTFLRGASPMLKAGLLPRDAVSHRSSQGSGARVAPATTGPLTRPVVVRRAPTGFGLFEALIEPSAAVVWLVACVRLGGDSFDSR